MKRDMDLVRKLLLEIEACENPLGIKHSDFIEIKGHAGEEIGYHLHLLLAEDMIEAHETAFSLGGFKQSNIRLNWSGQDFLQGARDDGNWAEAQNRLKKAGGFSLEIAKQVLQQIILENLGMA